MDFQKGRRRHQSDTSSEDTSKVVCHFATVRKALGRNGSIKIFSIIKRVFKGMMVLTDTCEGHHVLKDSAPTRRTEGTEL